MVWPASPRTEFLRRIENAKTLEHDPVYRGIVMRFYRNNPIAWIEDWCITFDPRNVKPMPRLLPFLLFPRQRDYIDYLRGCLTDKESGLTEKCRDMGATWLCCAFSVWLWLFYDGTVVGWGSRKEEYVDDRNDPKAIFPKIRQIIEYLPAWQLPAGFTPRFHATYMKIINPANGSAITGEAGDNIGRGGRTTIYFKDESAHYEHPESVEAALGDNTDVQIDISSVNGSGNVFYRRRMAGEVWEPGKKMTKGYTRVFIFDWRDHPNKTQEWYDLRRAHYEREGLLHVFAQEVDRDYSGAIVGVIIPQIWVNAAVDAHIKLAHLGDWFSGEHVAGQDIADEGGDKNACAGRHGVVLRFAEHWAGDPGEAATEAARLCLENNIHELYYDSIGVGAGFKVGVNKMTEAAQWPKSVRVMKWEGSASPLDPTERVIPGDENSPTNEDQYLNLKAQAWFRLRTRFYKTFRAITKGETYPIEEMISLDSTMANLHMLKMELSQPIRKTSQSGKTMVDKKPDGTLSPNLADAVNQCYCATREVSIFDVL